MSSHDDLYDRRKSTPLWWQNKATDLLGAAASVYDGIFGQSSGYLAGQYDLGHGYDPRIAMPSVYYMLCALSVELLMKALIVQKGKEPEATHDLLRLRKSADVMCTEQMLEVLEVLKDYSIWAAKYPVPKENELAEFGARYDTALMKQEPLGPGSDLIILKPNEIMSWKSFKAFWDGIDAVYWKRDKS